MAARGIAKRVTVGATQLRMEKAPETNLQGLIAGTAYGELEMKVCVGFVGVSGGKIGVSLLNDNR
jgi:hypothetical protein